MDHVYIIEALRKDATSAAALILASTTASSAVTCVHRWSKSNSVSGAASLYLQIIQVKPNLMPCHWKKQGRVCVHLYNISNQTIWGDENVVPS